MRVFTVDQRVKTKNSRFSLCIRQARTWSEGKTRKRRLLYPGFYCRSNGRKPRTLDFRYASVKQEPGLRPKRENVGSYIRVFTVDHTVENHALKTTDNDLNRGLLSFRHLNMF